MAKGKAQETRKNNKLRLCSSICADFDRRNKKGYRVEQIYKDLAEKYFLSVGTIANYRFWYLAQKE